MYEYQCDTRLNDSFPLTSFVSPSTSITPTSKTLTGVVDDQQDQQHEIQSVVNQEISEFGLSRVSPDDVNCESIVTPSIIRVIR
jgi:hypothetical protein